MTYPYQWWLPQNHTDRRPFLLGRNKIQSTLREYFIQQDFIEVDPCQMQYSPGNETHLHAFQTILETPSLENIKLYLHTSPEFACKKLLAAGEERIFTFTHTFRNRERSHIHHPEFTMLEWYRVGEPYEHLMQDCHDIIQRSAEMIETKYFSFKGKKVDPFKPFKRISVAEAFQEYADIDLLKTIDNSGNVDREALKAQLTQKSIRSAEDDTWSDLFTRVLVEKVEPELGVEQVTILDRYPSVEAALARPCQNDGREAERFEVYVCGVELANAFGELTDAREQRRRFTLEMAEKQRIYGETYPLDEDFLEALELMPQSSGAALGFDRLALLATGAHTIEQVLWAPVPDKKP